jgi:CheY-like chemotaxis protein
MANETTTEQKVSSYLAKALGSMDRARGLTMQLLTFAKGGSPVKSVQALGSFIRETANFALSGSRVTCNFHIQSDLWPCDIDKNQIGQVIDNIVINAQQAMPDGGTIEIRAVNADLTGQDHSELRLEKYVEISVKDTGIGMPGEMLSRIFEPFYTTKPKGHGLGLATSYSIVRRHDGIIEVESEPGRGSIFRIYLPASPAPAGNAGLTSAVPYRGAGTVIIMDDEESMLEVSSEMLKSMGYRVICVKNGADAINAFISSSSRKGEIAGMIFDLTIPGGMGGKEAISEIRKRDPDIPVFVASGYAEDPIMSDPAAYGFTASLTKPFRLIELSGIFRKYLGPGS